MKFDKIIKNMIKKKESEMQSKHYCGIVVNGRLVSCTTNSYGLHAECATIRHFQKGKMSKGLRET